MTLIYIGCGTDFRPVIYFPNIKRSIYIDSQPRSEHGWSEYDSGLFFRSKYTNEFIQNLPKGFHKINIDKTYPDVYHNFLTDRTIFHYYNLPFPWTNRIYQYLPKKTINLLKYDISRATHIAICGHDPHVAILNLLPAKFTLITINTSFYPSNKIEVEQNAEDYPSVCDDLILNPDNQQRIIEVKYLRGDRIKTLKTYVDFIGEKYA